MSQSERRLEGLFSLFRQDQNPANNQSEEGTETDFQAKNVNEVPFWRASLSRREVLEWLILPTIPLTALVYSAFRVDIRWDGKPTYPPSPTRSSPVPSTPTPILRATTTSNLIVIPTLTPTLIPEKPSRTEILINSQ